MFTEGPPTIGWQVWVGTGYHLKNVYWCTPVYNGTKCTSARGEFKIIKLHNGFRYTLITVVTNMYVSICYWLLVMQWSQNKQNFVILCTQLSNDKTKLIPVQLYESIKIVNNIHLRRKSSSRCVDLYKYNCIYTRTVGILSLTLTLDMCTLYNRVWRRKYK